MKGYIKIKNNENKKICKVKLTRIIDWINKNNKRDINQWKLLSNDAVFFRLKKTIQDGSLKKDFYTVELFSTNNNISIEFINASKLQKFKVNDSFIFDIVKTSKNKYHFIHNNKYSIGKFSEKRKLDSISKLDSSEDEEDDDEEDDDEEDDDEEDEEDEEDENNYGKMNYYDETNLLTEGDIAESLNLDISFDLNDFELNGIQLKDLLARKNQTFLNKVESVLSLNKYIEYVYLNGIKEEKYLIDAWANNKRINTIILTNITEDLISNLNYILRKNKYIKNLELKFNNLYTVPNNYIEDLNLNNFIKTITLYKSHLLLEEIKCLDSIMKKPNSIETLLFNESSIKDEDMKYLMKVLKENTSIQTIKFIGNGITDKGIEYLNKGLIKNTSIKEIKLKNNTVTGEDIKYFNGVLNVNTSIKKITLVSFSFKDEQIISFLKSLENNTSLTCLKLKTFIEKKGVICLSKALKKNTSITSLILTRSKIGEEEMRYLSKAFEKNTSIKHIKLNDNFIGDKGMKYLSEALEKNTSITSIKLKGNMSITEKGIKHLGKAMMKNDYIIKISMDQSVYFPKYGITDKLKRNQKEREVKKNSFIQLLSILSKL
jgi:Ran GTPase-activating protein (RanGAP) involved in mRNA processing and transport